MTYKENIRAILECNFNGFKDEIIDAACDRILEQSIDKLDMMSDIYMEGVNMDGEYQGCWVRFKDIEKIIDKYIGKRRSNE